MTLDLSGVVGARRSPPPHLRRVPVQQALDLQTIEEGATTTYRLVLPFLPPSKNVIDGWPPGWKNGAKKKWLKAIAGLCAEQNIPRGCQRVGLAARLVFPSNARRDPQNYAQCLWNWVPDALVECGVLVDDNEGRIQIPGNWGIQMAVDTRVAPKKHRQRTILAVTVEHAKPRGHR